MDYRDLVCLPLELKYSSNPLSLQSGGDLGKQGRALNLGTVDIWLGYSFVLQYREPCSVGYLATFLDSLCYMPLLVTIKIVSKY